MSTLSKSSAARAGAVTLRPMRAEDVPGVAAIHVAAFRDATVDSLARAASDLREELQRPWAHVWVAEAAGRDEDGMPSSSSDGLRHIAGAILMWLVADEVHILDVATHPAHRRQGVGRALVAQAIALARKHGANHLFLEVRPSNEPAMALYRQAGFVPVGVRKRYYADDEDAVDMSLRLGGQG